jgi:hypothetical protein
MKRIQKVVWCILALVLFRQTVSEAQQIDAEHQKKAEWIIKRMSSEVPLPSLLPKGDTVIYQGASTHDHFLQYYTKREVNGKQVDTVEMRVNADDSLNTLFFEENYGRISKTMTGYSYALENGELTFAFLQIPTPIKDKPNCIEFDTNLERHHPDAKNDTTPTIDKDYEKELKDPAALTKSKERHRMSVSFYQPKLLKSIDELYDLLNK